MICFVILHYMIAEVTIKCVDSILALDRSDEDIKIIIVDNSSPNSSYCELTNYYNGIDEVILIKNEKNLGFANGNNIGYAKAKEFCPMFIVVMNNDMEIQQRDFLDVVKSEWKKYHFDIMGPDVYSVKEKKHQNPSLLNNFTIKKLKVYRVKLYTIRLFLIPWLFIRRIKHKIKKNKEESEDMENCSVIENCVLHGSCYIFAENFIYKTDNCFYPKTFMYFEAEILHYLAIKNQYKIMYDPALRVYHYEDMSTNATYKTEKKKYKFVIDCQIESSKVFLNLIRKGY